MKVRHLIGENLKGRFEYTHKLAKPTAFADIPLKGTVVAPEH